MPVGPDQYFILPDPRLTGRANLVSVTSEQGAFAGPVTGASTNDGQLYPQQSGDLAATAEDVDYLIQRAGGVGSAEFVYKQDTAAATEYRGKDDPRRIWKFSAPFISSFPGADSNTICYSRKFQRILVFGENTSGSGTIYCRYRSIGDVDYTNWAQVTFTPVREQESFDHELAALELDDGAILLFVRTDNVGGLQTDFDVYRSDDGGVTWQMHSEQLLARFTDGGVAGAWGTTLAAQKWRVRRSGDHIRLVQVISGGYLQTLLSTDRGVTWLHVGGTSTTPNAVATHGGSDDQYPFDFVSTNPESGEFLLVAKHTTGTQDLKYWIAAGEAQWGRIGVLGDHSTPAGSEARSVCMVNDDTHLLQIIFYTRGAGNERDNWTMRRFRLGSGNPSLNAGWEHVDDIIEATGFRHVPIRPELVVTGEGIAIYFAVGDQQVNYVEESLAVLGFLDVWTKRSLGAAGPGDPLTNSSLFDVYWAAWSGRPAPVGNSQVSNDTLWTESLVGTPSVSSTQDRLDLFTNAINEKATYTLSVASSAAPANWAYGTNGRTWGWVVKSDFGDGDVANDFHKVQITSSDGGVLGIDVVVRMKFNQAVVYDNVAASSLGTLSLDLDGAEHEINLFIIDRGSSVVCRLYARNLHTNVWSQTGELTLTEANKSDSLEFGSAAQPIAGSHGMEWRELWSAAGDVRRDGFTNPDDLIGAIARQAPQYIENGLQARWVGAGGVLGDSFKGSIGHAYSADNALVKSPRVGWRSTGIASQTMIFDADPEDGFGRFFHDSAAVFGLTDGSVTIDYDDNTGFASPVGGGTLSALVYSGLSVGSVRGDTIFLNAAVPQAGEAVDMIVQFDTGGAAGDRMLCTLHWDAGTGSYLTMEGEDLATAGVSAGNTFSLYERQVALQYAGGAVDGQRYMRLRFTNSDTHTDDHRLGALVAGHKLDITVPLDWRFSDNEQPNVTHYRTRGAVGWAYEEGPPQRTITGRVVGDANRWREQFRAFLSSFAGYEIRPVVLVLDDSEEEQRVVLGTVRSGTDHDNAAWYQDSNSVWREAGDLGLTLVEEV